MLPRGMEQEMISSKSNTKIKKIKKLQKSSKARSEEKKFIVEGPKMVYEAPLDMMLECFVGTSFFGRNKEEIIERGLSYELVSDEVFTFMSETKTPQGILGIIKQSDYLQEELLEEKGKAPLLLLLESVQDPGNLGTIFRTAEAAGVTGIFMDSKCADIYNPKSIRSTMGAIYRLPFIRASDFEKCLDEVKKSGVKLVATHIKATKSYDKVNYQGAVGIIIGNESSGLSKEILSHAEERIQIPMNGLSESLNVAIATGILVYEAYRQRR
jgi:TrmH family RNA methyltransferase